MTVPLPDGDSFQVEIEMGSAISMGGAAVLSGANSAAWPFHCQPRGAWLTVNISCGLPVRLAPVILFIMKCPVCNVDLQTSHDRGVEVEACPSCQGLWLTPAELDELENEVYSNEANKGSLYLTTQETALKCPICSAPLKQFDYRFFDLQLDCCPEHGFWLNRDQDNQILEIMRGEETRVERKFGTEASWTTYVNHLRSPTFFSKVKALFQK
jgi:Zn-finger nucleic acid-binding protein